MLDLFKLTILKRLTENNINLRTKNTQAVNGNQVNTKSYLDQFLQENEQSRRRLDFLNESNDSVKSITDNNFNDNNILNLDSITINRNSSTDY